MWINNTGINHNNQQVGNVSMIETLKGILTELNSKDQVDGVTLNLMGQSANKLAHVVEPKNPGNVILHFTSISINTASKEVFERGQANHNSLQIAVSRPQPVHFRCDMTAIINGQKRKDVLGNVGYDLEGLEPKTRDALTTYDGGKAILFGGQYNIQ
ncbi:MAG: hypothetical protein LKE61_09180 [Erysipelotrichaceae bacterium]|jgi:hypothetical protein|nr:hypothetical protein [Erysipelotrichaceae bacterium]MCH4043973.1 hypothetical protein [Erysipelotrichaceae bacterium]MCH4121188.1 hypothetical protein [Erysipelotrichaceae bacterium]